MAANSSGCSFHFISQFFWAKSARGAATPRVASWGRGDRHRPLGSPGLDAHPGCTQAARQAWLSLERPLEVGAASACRAAVSSGSPRVRHRRRGAQCRAALGPTQPLPRIHYHTQKGPQAKSPEKAGGTARAASSASPWHWPSPQGGRGNPRGVTLAPTRQPQTHLSLTGGSTTVFTASKDICPNMAMVMVNALPAHQTENRADSSAPCPRLAAPARSGFPLSAYEASKLTVSVTEPDMLPGTQSPADSPSFCPTWNCQHLCLWHLIPPFAKGPWERHQG